MNEANYEGCRTPAEVAAARGKRIGNVVYRLSSKHDRSPYGMNRAERRKGVGLTRERKKFLRREKWRNLVGDRILGAVR